MVAAETKRGQRRRPLYSRPVTTATGGPRRVVSLGFLGDTAITAVIWLVDAVARGWTFFGAVSLGLVVLFALGFAYFALLPGRAARPAVQG
jgi:hypothetical protein